MSSDGSSSSLFQPLRDVFADAYHDVEVGPNLADEAEADGGAAREQHRRALGEVGGVVFHDAALYTTVGGAIYPPMQPFGSIPVAHADDRVSRRRLNKRQHRSMQQIVKDVVRDCVLGPLYRALPLLRGVVPVSLTDIATTPTLVQQRSRDPHRVVDAVVAMAFHRHLPVLAVATRDGSNDHRVHFFDVSLNQRMHLVLTHAFQSRGIHSLAWKPYSRDCLAVGCVGGVLCWSLSGGAATVAIPSSSTRPAVSHPYGPIWGGITDDTPISVWHRCTTAAPTSVLEFSSEGRYLASSSEHSVTAYIHDVSLKPRSALVMASVALEGGTSALCFSYDDQYLVRAIRYRNCIKILSTSTATTDTIETKQPVGGVVRVDSDNQSDGCFLLRYENTEGVALVRFARTGSQQGGSPSTSMIVLALLATGVHRGIGGTVRDIAADGRRLYLNLRSGHTLIVAMTHPLEGGVQFRGVGMLEPTAAPPVQCMTVFPGFPNGSLLATTDANIVQFIPSYYSR